MRLFAKKKQEFTRCSCGGKCDAAMAKTEGATADHSGIKILGSGCKKCNELEANTKQALQQLQRDTVIDHVTDFVQIASYGVMTTPALVANGKVLSSGKVLKPEEIAALLQKEGQSDENAND